MLTRWKPFDTNAATKTQVQKQDIKIVEKKLQMSRALGSSEISSRDQKKLICGVFCSPLELNRKPHSYKRAVEFALLVNPLKT